MGPQGFLGIPPGTFRSDYYGPRVGSGRTTRVRITDLSAEAWIRSPSADTKARFTAMSAEVWTKLYRYTSLGFVQTKDRMGPRGFLGIPPVTFSANAPIGIYNPFPPPVPVSTLYVRPSVGIMSTPGFSPRSMSDGPGGRFGSPGGGIRPINPTVNFRATSLSLEVWVASDPDAILNATIASAEFWVQSDRDPWMRSTDQSLEVWTRISDLPASAIRAFLWVD
jgi:hypothetical protein